MRRPAPARAPSCRSRCSRSHGCAAASIVMLEPRRLATRAVAERMARTLGERAGETVGYRMRLETRVEPPHAHRGRHRRRVHAHAAERSGARRRRRRAVRRVPRAQPARRRRARIRARRAATTWRPSCALLAMSATLDGARVAKLLGDAPVIESRGRMFPVECITRARACRCCPAARRTVDARVARAVKRALDEAPGDLLVFLPGAGEIRRVQRRLLEDDASATTSTCCRCTASSRPASRTRRCCPRARAAARSCSRPTSPRRASPSRACASSSTRGSNGAASSIRPAA